jgi:pyruvate carboxylase subunit B
VKYHVMLGDRFVEVEVDGAEVLIGGRRVHAEVLAVPGTPLRHLVVEGAALTLAVIPDGPGRWTLLDRGEGVEVEVLDERTRHIRSLVGAGRAHAGGGAVKAPMPGLVMKVLVTPGTEVTVGTPLVVLEAMKMENELRAVAPGVVEAILVEPGKVVEKGQVLVVLGASPST